MKSFALGIVFVSLAALAACGSKSKSAPTTPEPSTDEMAVTEERAPEEATQPESTATAAAPARSLEEVIYFEFDSANLDDASRRALNENYQWLSENPARTLTIEGHTDEVGTAEYNLGLGERRAQAARDYLVRLGVDPSRITIITYGEERPASSSDDQNRRSVFVATRK